MELASPRKLVSPQNFILVKIGTIIFQPPLIQNCMTDKLVSRALLEKISVLIGNRYLIVLKTVES